MTASATVMRRQRVVMALLAVFVHTASVAVAGRLRLVPHAVALIGALCPMLTASTADIVEFGREATMDLGPGILAARLIRTTSPAHSLHELAIPGSEQRVRAHMARVALTNPMWVTRIARVIRAGRILWIFRIGRIRRIARAGRTG